MEKSKLTAKVLLFLHIRKFMVKKLVFYLIYLLHYEPIGAIFVRFGMKNMRYTCLIAIE